MSTPANESAASATAAQRAASAAGYSLREGSYQGTTDDVLGTWYVVHESDEFFRPLGRGHATKGAAWLAAARTVRQNERIASEGRV